MARLAEAGLTNMQTAARLGISYDTVKAHLNAIYRKLCIRGRDELKRHPYKSWD